MMKNQAKIKLFSSKAAICDPDAHYRERLVRYFSSRKMPVLEFLDSKNYLHVLEKFQPDVVFVDIDWVIDKEPCFIEDLKTKLPKVMCILSLGDSFRKETHDLLRGKFDGFLCKNIIEMALLDHIMGNFFQRMRTQEQKEYYNNLLEKQIDMLKKRKNQIAKESHDKLIFIKQLSSNLQLPLNQLIQFAHIGLQRIHRKQTILVGSYLAEVKLISEELMIYINDLKEISLLKTGESEFNLEEVDTGEFLKAIQRQFQPIADGRNVNFSVQTSLPRPCIMADYNKLSKVMNILLRNAFRYVSARGTVKIAAKEKGHSILLEVSDNGPGIPEDLGNRLFNMYDQRTVKEETRRIMGFGLSICKELMIGQSGDIWLDADASKKGTTFVLSLPVAQSILD